MEEEGFGRRHVHMHTISSTQPQKMALTVILLLHLKAKVQASLHIYSAQFFCLASSCQTTLFKNCYSPSFF